MPRNIRHLVPKIECLPRRQSISFINTYVCVQLFIRYRTGTVHLPYNTVLYGTVLYRSQTHFIPWSSVAFYGWSSLSARVISFEITVIVRIPELRVKIHFIPEIRLKLVITCTVEARYYITALLKYSTWQSNV